VLDYSGILTVLICLKGFRYVGKVILTKGLVAALDLNIYNFFFLMFVPSAGSKWLIEAPYLLQAATQLHVNLGWVVQIYNTAEALPNLINPFWMLPLLGLLRIPAP
jgi:short subunit fatty acids transporter